MTKNAFDQVKEIFGSRCEQTVIDRETCAKIVIDEAHDIEISGCGTKNRPFSVYLWLLSPHLEILEREFDITSLDVLEKVVNSFTEKVRAN